jgi:DNA repair protein RadC
MDKRRTRGSSPRDANRLTAQQLFAWVVADPAFIVNRKFHMPEKEVPVLVRELRVTYRVRADLPPVNDDEALSSPRVAAGFLARLLGQEAIEVFGVLCLTTKHRLIGWHEVSRGCLDATLVHPREVFKVAFLANAAAVIIAHCHPSGDPAPSPEDARLTNRLVAAGELVGVHVLDHVIIGHDSSFYSFRESGTLST